MTWLRLDDGFCEHPKVAGLSARAFRAHLEALCYSARYLTDGIVPKKARKCSGKIESELQVAGLWVIDLEGNVVIHDYLEWNPSKAHVLAKREKDSARKSGGIPKETGKPSARNLLGFRASRPVLSKEGSNEPSAKKRERDPIWDALVEIFGSVEPGTWAHGKRNNAVKQLRLCGATAESVASARHRYSKMFPEAAVTDVAIAKHYPQLVAGSSHANGGAPTPPCPECEVGGGMHAADCSRRSDAP
jgi:hypothetical protein